jgi:hypothetical protein
VSVILTYKYRLKDKSAAKRGVGYTISNQRRRIDMPMEKPKTKSGKKDAVKETMGEFKRGELHSGSSKGAKVKNRKQAVAIAMKQSGQSKDKTARRKRLEDKQL